MRPPVLMRRAVFTPTLSPAILPPRLSSWRAGSAAVWISSVALAATIASERVFDGFWSDDAGHALMAEQPDAVLDALFHFAR